MKVTPLTTTIGAEITGLDLGAELSGDTMVRLHRAWLEHLVLVIRGQDIYEEQQRRFAGCFGELGDRVKPPVEHRPDGPDYYGDMMLVSNIRVDGKPIGLIPDGEMWFHHDMCYVEEPHKASFLYGVEIPSTGGNTRFANMYAAFDALPQAIKDAIRGRTVLQAHDFKQVEKLDVSGELDHLMHFHHPVAITHPETGRKALYVNRLMSQRIDGLSPDESDELLETLFRYGENPDFIYEHHWRPNDLVFWDNRCSTHARTDFPPSDRRLMRRCTVFGERPFE